MDNFLGQITLYACNFPPKGWAQCEGQLMSISQNAALFSLLGTNFGGNGTSTFGLPDLRGRVPNGQGQGPGLSSYDMGQTAGEEAVTLTQQTVPQHNHSLMAYTGEGTTTQPAGGLPAQGDASGKHGHTTQFTFYHAGAPNVSLASSQCTPAGGGSSIPHVNIQPSLAATWCIALTGVYPSRS